jgi:hypothetical protein
MAATYPIRAITDEFEALCAVPTQAFLETMQPEAQREVIAYDRTIAAFDAGQMVGERLHLSAHGAKPVPFGAVSSTSRWPVSPHQPMADATSRTGGGWDAARSQAHWRGVPPCQEGLLGRPLVCGRLCGG